MDIAALIARASAESDFDDAVRVIQSALGVTDGGYADHHFSGSYVIAEQGNYSADEYYAEIWPEFRRDMIRGYFESELASICDGLGNAEILDFFAQVDLATELLKRDGVIDNDSLAKKFGDHWTQAFGEWDSNTDALSCFLDYVWNAASVAAGVALLASHDTMLAAPAAPATPESDDFKRGYDRGYEDGFSDGANNA